MNKTLLLFTGVLITALTNCEKPELSNEYPNVLEETDTTKVIQFKNNQAVVFTNDFLIRISGLKIPKYYHFSELHVPDSSIMFEPSISALTKFESKLETYLQQTKRKAELLDWETAEGNDRLTLWNSQAQSIDSTGQLKQYWGFVEQNSDSILFGTFWSINTGSDNIIKDWKSSPILINDGGPGFYTARYNLSTDCLIDIFVNGF